MCTKHHSLETPAGSHEKALVGIVKLVYDVIEDRVANDEVIPEPFSEQKYSGKFQLRIPPAVHRNITIEAAEQGVSINRYVASKLA